MTRSRNPKSQGVYFNKRPAQMAAKGRKAKIKVALREQVWLRHSGPVFTSKCQTRWCHNDINVFNFQCGHVLAESKGGPTTVENLVPLCSRCNQSMGTMHMDAWNCLGAEPQQPKSKFAKFWQRFRRFFSKSNT
jgi:5-methylcytosine-specific restriction endonuclease McrA